MDDRAEEVLGFWFGELGDPFDVGANGKMWWQKSDEVDQRIRERFGADIERAAAGELDAWKEEPRSALALVILLDQFSRNVFRGSARAFGQDERALAVTRECVRRGHDDALRMVEKMFLSMPLMHSEDLADHDQLAGFMETVVAGVPDDRRGPTDGWRRSAAKHREILERFGRYPHRNALLGRVSTAEEEAFLAQPGSSF